MACNVEELTTALSKTTVVESGLSFAGKSLVLNTAEDAKQVTDQIDTCNKLQYLNLEGNTLGIEAAKAIGKSLEKHPEFIRALWKDMFTGRMKTEIPKALEHLGQGLVKAGSRLTELNMSDNAFGPIGVEGLANFLRSSSCYALQELKLNNNGLGITGGKLLASALTDCFTKSKAEGKQLALKVIIAGRNRLENEGAAALANVFKLIETLEEVSMPQNGIYHRGITALSEAFVHNKNLQILDLNDNTIGPKGAEALAKALPHLQKIKELNFGDCLLKTKGAKCLAEALTSKHENLEKVTLSFNEIKTSGGIALVKALRNKPKFKSLTLGGNQFGEEGCKQIRQELKAIAKGDIDENISEDDEEDEDGEEEESEGEDEPQDDSDVETCNLTVEEFLVSPTPDNFLKIGDERKNLILKETRRTGDIVLKSYLEILMKVSSLYSSRNEMVRNFSLDVTEQLYRELFAWAALHNNSPYVFNSVFVYLGLIKSEDKGFKFEWDCKACQNALKDLKDGDCLPSLVKSILDVFFPVAQNGA